jgi:hypothetical protein
VNILEAIDASELFSPWFKARETWRAWRAFLAALFGLPMTEEQVATYRACTGRLAPPQAPAKEAWLICGRRAGKSFTLAVIAVFLATFRDYAAYLQPGERATIMVIAKDRKQARTILRYVRALLTDVPMLAALIERETAESFDLGNAVTIEVGSASYRSTRGYTVAAALCDEIAFWPVGDESADPDRAILDALRPAMLTIPGAMLLCASSPYAKKGMLWETRCRHYGEDGPVLVWQAPTLTMNPTVPKSDIDEEYERDPQHAAAEFGAEFRSDLQSYIEREAVEACVDRGVRERPHERRWTYFGFTDPSGGAHDSFTLAIAHKENKTVVLDVVREAAPPFSPEQVVEEFCALLKAYRLTKVHGDRFGGQWPQERFREHGINYELSERTRSDIYRYLLPLLNSRAVGLLDNPRLVTQIASLERRTGRVGKDAIDHPPNAHDDLCNSAAGALALAWDGRAGAGRAACPPPPSPSEFADPLAAYRVQPAGRSVARIEPTYPTSAQWRRY